MKAIVTVIGADRVGIIASVCAILARHGVNVMDISQTVMQGYFTMIMLVDITKLSGDFSVLQDNLSTLGDSLGLKIHTMHEDIFNSMHSI